MDGLQFDDLTRRYLNPAASRRHALFALALGSLMLRQEMDDAAAGPSCKSVGKKCKRAKDCCSGVCKGRKGKKTCKSHDSWGCKPGLDACLGPYEECLIAGSEDGNCYTTTGNAGYCSNWSGCVSCTRDADCRPFCGPSAACVHCASCANSGGTACAGTGDCQFPP